MKLKKRKPNYKIPAIGLVHSAGLMMEGDIEYALAQVSHEQLQKTWQKAQESAAAPVLGRPVMFAVVPGDRLLTVWPVPDTDYEMHFRFYPPIVEI